MRREKEQKALFQLIKSVLLEEPITIEVEGLDWKYLQQLCKYQKIDNLVSYGILPLQEQEKIPADVVCAMQKAQQKGIAREATQYFSLQEIQQKFEEEQIEHLPLKGAQLKKEYPSPDMRFLTDLDILCQKEQQGKIQAIMESLGYTLEHGGGHHDVYVRNPFMTVEIHWDCSTENRELDVFLEDIWSKCIRKEGFAFAYQMPWEEYYVYMIGHMAKHLKYGGIGIRMLLDLFVFAQKKKDSCDWKKIEVYLERGGLLKFSETMHRFLQQCMEEDKSFFDGNKATANGQAEDLDIDYEEKKESGASDEHAGNSSLEKPEERSTEDSSTDTKMDMGTEQPSENLDNEVTIPDDWEE